MTKASILAVALFTVGAFGQNPTQPQSREITTTTVAMLNPPIAPSGVTVGFTGSPGSSAKTVYYWLVSNFTVGNSTVGGPYAGFNAPTTLSGSNFFTVYWQSVAGANSYDLLRTSTPTPPTGTCTCAVATAISGTSQVDQSNSLSAYTVNTFSANSALLQLTAEAVGPGASNVHYLLKQNGVLVQDLTLSAGGGPPTGAAGGGLTGFYPNPLLANPSPTTLGGVESIVAVSHQWINSISTSGIPSQTQPAFTDISGVLTGAQLPNPSSITLGGIESFAAVTHQWINSISTAGVPASTQPAFGDLSGSVAGSQMPALTGDCTTSAGAVNVTCGSAIGRTANPLSQFGPTTSAQLFSVISDESGSGLLVGNNSPTILIPTIADFTNANHNHTNAAGGGLLTGAALTSISTTGILIPGATGATGTTTAPTDVQNSVTCMRFVSPATVTATHFSYMPAVSAGAGSHVGFAIFDTTGNATRLMTTGALDGTLTGKRTQTVASFTLIFGTAYLECWTTDSATPTSWQTYGNSNSVAVLSNLYNTTSTNNIVTGGTASAAGAPPTTLGTLTVKTSGGGVPYAFVEP